MIINLPTSTFSYVASSTHLPKRISLRGEKAEVLLSQLDRWQSLHLQVSPRLDERYQAFKGVQAQPIVPIVGQMRHEDTNLGIGRTSTVGYILTDAGKQLLL